MALVFTVGRQLFVVLDEENVDRIVSNDPFELTPVQTQQLTITLPLDVVIAYATKAEYAHLKTLSPPQLVKYLNRGYRFTDTDAARLKEPPSTL